MLLKCARFVAQASGGFPEVAKRNKGSEAAAKMMQQRIFCAAVNQLSAASCGGIDKSL